MADGKVKIETELDQSGFKSGLQKMSATAKTETAGLKDSFSKVGTFVKSGIGVATKAIGASVAAAAAGLSTLSGLSIKAYASYEQLKGGVETLFGAGGQSIEEYAKSVGKGVSDVENEYNSLIAAQQTVLNNADAAWQTAGLSANDYMDTVTSFSASLLQGLGGDTQKAAEIADQAVVDMSDNANKMGTDMTLIQNAYQGFAKQNFTMLDNLKLGYGGTQAEMARLINDSGVLGDSMEVTAETVNQVSFDKIIEAIHVVQENMGIAGTTSEEAATTIEGSVNSMKAAWENLLTAFSADGWDVGVYAENFASSVVTVIQNLMPRIQEVLPNIADGISLIIEELGPYLLDAFETLLPYVIEGAIYLVAQLAAEIPTILGTVIQAIQTALFDIFSALPTDAQTSIQNLAQTLQTLAPVIAAVTAAILVFRTAMTISEIINGVTTAMQTFKTANEATTIAQAALNAVMNANPFVLVATLIAAVVAALITLWNTNEGFREAVTIAWDAIVGTFSAAVDLIKSAWDGIGEFFSDVWEDITDAFSDAVSWFTDLGGKIVNGIKDGISVAWNGLTSWFNGLWDSLFGNRNVNVNVNANGSGIDGSNKNGLSYVPFDGYISELHEGEMVLTKQQANSLRSMVRSGINGMGVNLNPTMQGTNSYGGSVVNQTVIFEGDVDDPDVVTRKMRQMQQYGLAGARA